MPDFLRKYEGKPMNKALAMLIVGSACLFSVSTAGQRTIASLTNRQSAPAVKPSPVKLEADFGRMPLVFVANEGQLDERVSFYVQGKDKSLYFTEGGVTFVLNKQEPRQSGRMADRTWSQDETRGPRERHVVKLDFVGADPDIRPAGEQKTDTIISYFKGKKEDWHTGLPTYGRVVYRDLWPGIDLGYSGTFGKLKYEFTVRPGADPSRIRLAYRGADAVILDADGRLEVRTPLGSMRDDVPVAFQMKGGKRVEVPMSFALDEAAGSETLNAPDQGLGPESRAFGFRVGEYDRDLPLILDPVILVYCGYIGGSGDDLGQAIAIDPAGATYVTGTTDSPDASFPDVVGPDVVPNGLDDAFVAKIRNDGSGLVYCGYIGGSSSDFGTGIAVDGSGYAYVTGYTSSSSATFPDKVGPDLSHNGLYDAFVAKVSASGNSLVYCGYIGGGEHDYGRGIAVDSSGAAYVVGETYSNETTFPEKIGPDLTHNGGEDAFVAKVSYVLGKPGIGLSRQALSFGAVAGGVATGAQSVLLGNAGEDTLSWTAGSNKAWLSVDPTFGTNAAKLQVSVNPAGLAAGIQTGTITVSDPDASNSPKEITVTLRILAAGTSSVPFGDFATPINGTVGITGAIPVTGWVLDDVESTKVEIWREPIAGEAAGIKFIGDAVFVEGARPDVEALYPASPLNYRSGWGYMMLTNFLPGQGNGTYVIYAFATDKEGNSVLMDSKTITCDNAHAVKPFGTIDTPPQGGDASVNPFVNFGWVLTPQPKTVQKTGIKIHVYVDGIELGNLAVPPNIYDQFRADVSGLFPGLNNSNGPVGAFYVDTMMFANGTHTIYWTAEDDAGAADGIGSRYFNIFNGGAAPPGIARAVPAEKTASLETAMNVPASYETRKAKRGFASNAELEIFQPDQRGTVHIDIREVEPVVLDLGVDPALRGYLVAERELRPLPIGSTLDGERGLFSWLPGPGFVGTYELVFLRTDESGLTTRIPVRITIRPKFDKK